MSKYLSISSTPSFDESISSKTYHSYSPFIESYNEGDSVRICIQNQDLVLLPCESYLYVEGAYYSNDAVVPQIRLVNNCVAFMFDEIRYELNGVEIDYCRNVGITATLKNYISLTKSESDGLLVGGWCLENERTVRNGTGNINFCIPLNKLLGFCEDYNRVIPNAKHELILTRASTNDNAVIWDNNILKYKFQLSKILWKIPHISLNDNERLKLYKTIQSSRPLQIAFRSWDLYEYPSVPKTTHHVWRIKTANQLEKPRFIVFAFQIDKLSKSKENAADFDSCKLVNFKAYLNSESYPYENLKISYTQNKYADLYYMYSKFRESYYDAFNTEPLLNVLDYKKFAPIVVIDCSHQNEMIKSGPVDVKVEFETEIDGIKDNTTAFCLLLHDRIVEYSPLSGNVRKLI